MLGASLGTDARMGRVLTLVPLEPGDAERLGHAFAAMDPWANYPYPASALTQYLADVEVGAPRYAIRAGTDLAGAVGLRLNWLRGPYLQFLGVLPPYQRLGIGGRLLSWMEHEARQRGERNLWVCASDFNRDGIRFYERHGFARTAVLQGLVSEGRTELLMRKRLTGASSA